MIENMRIGGVSERDMDLMLLEEFVSSSDFGRWFALEAGYPSAAEGSVARANRSVTNSTGESDLEVDFNSPGGPTYRILIENKVGAGFQPEQAERYRQRGDGYVRNGEVSDYRTVLVAPTIYFSGELKGFDARVDYESILSWCAQQDTETARYVYKMALIHSAIEKSRTGYQVVEDAAVSEFWRDYWETVCRIAPELDMPEPGIKPGGSSFVLFRTPTLPKSISLQHKLTHGHVDLEFRGKADSLPTIRKTLGRKLLKDMSLVRAAKSAAIRIKVPKLALTDPFNDQVDEVGFGIETADRLHRWASENVDGIVLVSDLPGN